MGKQEKYIVLRKRPRQRSFTAFSIAPVTKKQAQKEARLHRELGAKSQFRTKKIKDLKLAEVRNLAPKDIARLWKKR